MRLLHEVVAARCRNDLNVLHPVEHGKFPQGCAITPELIGMDDLRHVIFHQQPMKKRFGSFGIPVFLKEHVEHGSVFIDRSPQPMFDPADIHVHLVKVPPGTPTGFPVA